MQMLCYKCGRSWNYKGKNSEGKGYITCPGCLYKIRVDKALMEEPFKQELLIKLPKKKIISKELPKKLPTNLPTIEPLEIEQEEKIVEIKEIPWNDFDIRIIPRDPIELIEHQRSFL